MLTSRGGLKDSFTSTNVQKPHRCLGFTNKKIRGGQKGNLSRLKHKLLTILRFILDPISQRIQKNRICQRKHSSSYCERHVHMFLKSVDIESSVNIHI